MRRDIIALLASVEVMLGGALVLLVGLGASVRHGGDARCRSRASRCIVIVVVAAEAAVGLALLVAVARRRGTTRDRRPERGEGLMSALVAAPWLAVARAARAGGRDRTARQVSPSRLVPWVAMIGPLLVLASRCGRSRRYPGRRAGDRRTVDEPARLLGVDGVVRRRRACAHAWVGRSTRSPR